MVQAVSEAVSLVLNKVLQIFHQVLVVLDELLNTLNWLHMVFDEDL